MKVLKRILLALAIIIVLVIVVGFFLPSHSHVERSIVIKAPQEVIFGQINSLKNWNKWSPWAKKDPNMQISYSGPDAGVGSSYTWKGNREVMSGKQTIITSTAPSLVVNEMRFEGFDEPSIVTFKIDKADEGSKVTWSLESETGNNPIHRYFGLMMDKMVGPDFESGLANLKQIAESLPKKDTTANASIVDTTVAAQPAYCIAEHCSADPGEIGKKLGAFYQEIGAMMKKNNEQMAGPVFAVYNNYSPQGVDVQACVPVAKTGKTSGRVTTMETKAGRAIKMNYWGDYTKMNAAHKAVQDYIAQKHLTISGAPWEVYITDPMNEKDTAKWLTQIYYPVQ